MADDPGLRNRTMDYFGVAEKHSLVTRQIGGGIVGISRLRYDGRNFAPVSPPDVEDAVLLHLHLRPQIAEISIDGQPCQPLNTSSGHINLLDFRQRFEGRIHKPFDMIGFHIPFSAFDALAPDFRNRTVRGVTLGALDGVDDPEVRGLGMALLPSFERPEQTNQLFIDHLGWALAAHVGRRYGELVPSTWRAGGKLATWQERRTKELIEADLATPVRLADLASTCGLSVGYFSRAFRETCGMPPHRWLTHRRIERAKALMIMTDQSIASIASECGFSDQSHFTRRFLRAVGASPAAWRKDHQAPPAKIRPPQG